MSSHAIRGFTLVEISVVAAIMGVLAYGLFLFLNPADLQRRARDEKRFRDLQSLDAILNQYVAAGNEPICIDGCNSLGTTEKSDPCDDSNWLQTDLCDHASSIPLDPANGSERDIIYMEEGQILSAPAALGYYCKMRGGEWHCLAYQESKTYAQRTQDDNCGCYKKFMEIRSGPIIYGDDVFDTPCDETNSRGELCSQSSNWF